MHCRWRLAVNEMNWLSAGLNSEVPGVCGASVWFQSVLKKPFRPFCFTGPVYPLKVYQRARPYTALVFPARGA